MNSRPREIQRKTISLLRDCPLVREVEPFGSLPKGMDDAYSDIDLRVDVDDLPSVISSRHQVLVPVGKAEIEWLVHLRSDSFCSSLLLAGESCYHKVDLEFCSHADIDHTELEEAALAGPYPPGLYLPAPGTPGHFLVGQLIGATRYTKARKRRQNTTCWRFTSAMVDWLCVLYYERAHGCSTLHRKLNTGEHVSLDNALDPQVSKDICAALDFSSPGSMNSGVIMILDRMIKLLKQKGISLGCRVPDAPIGRLSEFLRTELMPDNSSDEATGKARTGRRTASTQ